MRTCSQRTLSLLPTRQPQATSHPPGRDPASPAPVTLPHPGKGSKVLGVLGNYQRQKGEGAPGRKLAVSFSFEKGETEAPNTHELDVPGWALRPGIPLCGSEMALIQPPTGHCCPLPVTLGESSG